MMTKAQQLAAEMSSAELSVLNRMEADSAIAPGAWTCLDYEIIERSPRLYKSMFVSPDKGFGHTLTAFGKRVQTAARSMGA